MAETLQDRSLEELREEYEVRLEELLSKLGVSSGLSSKGESSLPEAPETPEAPISYDESIDDVRLAAARRAQEQM